MAGETFLLSGNQLATYTGWSDSYPPPDYNATITYTGVSALGSESDRYFLVRTSGSNSTVSNNDLYEIYPAVDDGTGTLVPGPTPLYTNGQAQPGSYDGATAGDTYVALGMFYGDDIIVNLDGFDGTGSFVAIEGSDGDDDGELQLSEIAAANPDSAPCFAMGCPIETVNGPVAVEKLQIGTLILTKDNGLQPLRFVSQATVQLCATNEHLRPVRISKGTLGDNVPSQDVRVSPQHRIVVGNWKSELMLGHSDVFCAAKHLVDGQGVAYDHAARSVNYVHLHFDQHEILQSAGMWSESIDPLCRITGSWTGAQRQEFRDIFGQTLNAAAPTHQIALPVLKAYEAKLLRSG